MYPRYSSADLHTIYIVEVCLELSLSVEAQNCSCHGTEQHAMLLCLCLCCMFMVSRTSETASGPPISVQVGGITCRTEGKSLEPPRLSEGEMETVTEFGCSVRYSKT